MFKNNLPKTRFNNAVGNMKKLQSQSEKLSKDYLNKLTSTKDKDEYSNLLKSYKEQSDITRKIKDKITRIEYASENNNYTAVMEDLNSFKTDFDKVMQKTRETRPLNKIESMKLKPRLFNEINEPFSMKSNIINSSSSELSLKKKKSYIDFGMGVINLSKKYINSPELLLL